MNRRLVLMVIGVLVATALACELPIFGSSRLDPPRGSDGPSASLYENRKSIEISEEDQVAFIDDFFPEAYSFESSTDFSWTDDTAADIRRYLDDRLVDPDDWRIEQDWIFFEWDGMEPQRSIWKYGDLLLGVLLIDNLDSESILQLGKRYGLTKMEPGTTLIVMHLWDKSKIIPTPTSTATLVPSDTPPATDTRPPTLTWTPQPSATVGPTSTPAIASEGSWSVVAPGLPADFNLAFPGLVQCREKANSPNLTQEYMGVVAVRYLPQDTWIRDGNAELIVETDAGFELGRYPIFFSAAPDSLVWLMPRDVQYGQTISAGDSRASVFKLLFKELRTETATASRNNFRYDVQVVDHGTFGNPEYPQHRFLVVVNNLGDLAMKDVYVFGLLKDSKGNTVDVLTTERSKDIPFGGLEQYELKSMSGTGRCVGPIDPQGYTLHYWLEFESADRQPLSDYFTLPVQ